MTNVARIELVHELSRAGMSVPYIAERVERHRATVYRWRIGIKLYGIQWYLRKYQSAKKGHRHKRKTDPITKAHIYQIREEFKGCCGEKIQYWLKKRYGGSPSRSTIYRVLNEKYRLRSAWQKNKRRGPVPQAEKPREVIQADTVDFGGVFAFTAIDIFTREASAVLTPKLDSRFGAWALKQQMKYFGETELIQRDGGPEFMAEWEETAQRFAKQIRTARPYKKNEQAFIEVFNRTLRKECLGWLTYRKEHLPALQAELKRFLVFYNTERPHLSLGMKAPKDMCRI